jgi:uncharacterized C2H2 Zn-finger protein
MEEIWKDAKDYEQYLKVSNLGRVFRKEREWITGKGLKRKYIGKIIEPSIMRGYCYIPVGRFQRNLHRIIANTFIPNPNDLKQVNHINGIKSDNRIENLEWISPSDNQKHAYKFGFKKPTRKLAKLIFQYDLNNNFVKKWDCITDAHKSGFNRAAIIRCAKGKQITSYGYKWSYE